MKWPVLDEARKPLRGGAEEKQHRRSSYAGAMRAKSSVATRLRIYLAAAVVLTASSACTRGFDMRFVNPCDHEIKVETASHPPDETDFGVDESFSIDPLSIEEVDSAFTDARGMEWSIRVDGTIYEVDGEAIEHDTVVIPAQACNT